MKTRKQFWITVDLLTCAAKEGKENVNSSKDMSSADEYR